MYRNVILLTLLGMVMACSTTPGPIVTVDSSAGDAAGDAGVDTSIPEVVSEVANDGRGEPDTWQFDTSPDVPFAECEPGTGCFLDPCTENSQCQSGFCVDHLGEGVCSQLCQEECPPGWSCQQVGAGGPDLSFACVSKVANLCRPCGGGADCKSPGGAEDVCVAYGEAGSFCGGSCEGDEDCPWGFSCTTTETVEGNSTVQCVADAGICPCTGKSVALALSTPCQVASEFGTCGGNRVCTEGGLTDCDALDPAEETCDGFDNDCDGDIDEGAFVEDEYFGLCDDGNPCSKDQCNGADGCEHVALLEGECQDGNPCTVADHCVDGVCVGDAVQCDDNNPCTENLCVETGGCTYPPQAGECDDGEACTLGDHCIDGECQGEAVPCDCHSDADCAVLEDGDPCTGTLFCDKGSLPFKCAIVPDSVVVCPPPGGPDALCLAATCNPATGTCLTAPANDGKPCDDGDGCTLGDTCGDGLCQPGAAANCNDGIGCTADSCDDDSGCQHDALEGPCSDGNACTAGDACVDGQCEAGQVVDCDDGNPCSDDGCDSQQGCWHSPTAGFCDDNNPCTVGDHCAGGTCVAESYLSCNDDNPCTADSCTPGNGCIHEPTAGICSDGDPCTANDFCKNGVCMPGPAQDCDDGNGCTADSCTAEGLCLHTATAGACDDGNPCTLGDACKQGLCVAGSALACDDDDVCTTDSCTPAIGCVHTLNSAPCDDGSICTTGDHCHLGECIHSGELTCGDNNPCTADSCDDEGGCQYIPTNAPCDDSNPCTTGDTCANGICLGGGDPDCDDDNPCTDDTCNGQQGCQHSFNAAACSDNNSCTTGDICSQGICQPTGTLNCDDANPCTDDACLPQSGCSQVPNQGDCPNGHCDNGECIIDCQPNCAGKECGNDGCGGSCGGCEDTPNAVCTQNHVCAVLPCSSDITCLPHGLVCNTDKGHCVQCRQNGECLFLFGQQKPFCDSEYDLCSECLTDGDCVDSVCNRGFVPAQCEPAGIFDVGEPCSDISHCLQGLLCDDDNTCESLCGKDCKPGVCNGDSGLCVDCHDHKDCGAGKVCVTKTCVPGTKCNGNGDCGGDTPVCLDGMCVECKVNGDCDEGYKCGSDNACHLSCLSSLACQGQVCNLAKQYCVACVLDLDCQAQGKAHCNSNGLCVDCVTDDHCAPGQFCSQGICEADACVPGVGYFCISGEQRLCNDAGSGYLPLTCGDDCCPEAQQCVKGECSLWAPTGESPEMFGSSCRQIANDGYAEGDGPYWVIPPGYNGAAFQVYCDMTTDGGGWTLVAWTGNSAASPRGVPYPGLNYCAGFNCQRGSGASKTTMQPILRDSSTLVKTQQTQTQNGPPANILAHQYSGKYVYNSLANLNLVYGNVNCGPLLQQGTFQSIKGVNEQNGKALYVAQSFGYSNYTYTEGNNDYIWNIGVPNSVCNGNGDAPGTWMGTWSESQYGPKNSSEAGAHSVWAR